MEKNIIILSNNYVNENDFDRFGYKQLSDYGFNVKWISTSLLVGGKAEKYSCIHNTQNYDEFRELIKSNVDSIFFIYISYNFYTRTIYSILKNFSLYVVNVEFQPLPNIYEHLNFLEKIITYFIKIKKRPILLYEKIFLKNNALKVNLLFSVFNRNSETILIPSIDYERSQLAIDLIGSIGKYALFLDEGVGINNDYKKFFGEYKMRKMYLQKINTFFDWFEFKYNMSVVIAGHPRIDYDDNSFEGREVVLSKTEQYSKSAEYIFAHHSSSISYPIIFNKKLLFLDTKVLPYNTRIFLKCFVEELKIKKILLDEEYTDMNLKNYFNINNYSIYQEKYLASKKLKSNSVWEIILDELELRFNK